MTLKSRSELLQEQSKNMDLIDVDQVMEVPDTPDRLAAATHNSNCNERQINASTNNQKSSKDCINGRIRNQQMEKGKSGIVNGHRRLFIHTDNVSSFKHPRPSVDTTRHDKGKSLCNSDAQKITHQEGGSFAGVINQNGHEHFGYNRVNVNPSRKGGLSLKTCKLNRTSDHGKGVDFLDLTHQKDENNAPGTSSKTPQKRMLVRNGCISPNNIAKSKHVAKKHESDNIVKEVQSGSSGTLTPEGQSNVVNIMDMVSEPKDSHRHKDKGVVNVHHHSSSKEPDAERWRTTHNHRKQRDNEQLKKDFENVVESKMVSSSSSMSHHAHSNRQKEGTSSRNLGKRSMSFVGESIGETSSSSSRPKRNKSVNGVGPSNQVVEPIVCDSEDSSVRALQLEADEMLARELQEQLYNEELTPVLGFDQMNSHLGFAMPAQQDNNSPQNVRSRRPYRRQTPSSSSNAQQPPTTSIQRRAQPRATSARMSNLRARFHPRPPTIPSTRRNSMFPSNMDLDMRMQILETLEAVGDMRRRPNHMLQFGREFNEDDYEMLLALDDNNHQHGGATPAQINNLPESTVQAENLQECSVCLETPTLGETIRHLPCLHRFHKACIDQWLRRKTSCPICKSSIT